MKNLFPKTTEEWCAKKRQFMRLLNQTDDPRMAQDYENAINFCDRGIAGVKPKAYKRVKYAVIAISIAVIVMIVLSGCHTVNGVGRDLSAWSSPYIEHQEK